MTAAIFQFVTQMSLVRDKYLTSIILGEAETGPQANATSFDDSPAAEIADALGHFVNVQR